MGALRPAEGLAQTLSSDCNATHDMTEKASVRLCPIKRPAPPTFMRRPPVLAGPPRASSRHGRILPQLNLRPLASLRAVQGTGIARPSFSTSQPRLTAGRSAIAKYQRLTLGCSAKSTVCQAKREIQGQMAISAME